MVKTRREGTDRGNKGEEEGERELADVVMLVVVRCVESSWSHRHHELQQHQHHHHHRKRRACTPPQGRQREECRERNTFTASQ
jgi:hypothetical protein